jgi:O-antigen/teichoic acid export membrane protein
MSFRRALIWSVAGQVVSYLILFGGSVVVARLLTPRDMGVFALATAMIGILNTIVAFNVSAYVVRAKELSQDTLESAFTINTLLSCAVAITIFGVSFLAKDVFGVRDVGNVLAPLSLIPILGIFEFRPATMLQREMNFKALSLINGVKGLLGTGATVVAALHGHSYMSLPIGNVLAAAVGVLCTNLVAGRHAGFRLSFGEGRQIAVFGLRMMSIGGVAALAARISDMAMGQILGLSALGLYSRASNISNLIFQNIYGGATRVVFVQLSNEFRDHGTVRDTFARSFEVITAILWPLQIGLAVLAPVAIYTLYGQRWLGAALPLSLLMVAQSVVLCFGMNWELFVLRDETAKQTRIEVIRAIAGVVTFIVGCMFNIAAAAAGRIAEALFGLALYRPHMDEMAEMKPGEMTRIYLHGLALTLAAVVPSALLMLQSQWSYRTSPGLVAGAIMIGIILWFVGLAVLKHPILDELQSLRRRLGLRA